MHLLLFNTVCLLLSLIEMTQPE